VRNLSDQTIVGQAVPSVSPTVAARIFQKLDCFCFKQQTLAPGESREMAADLHRGQRHRRRHFRTDAGLRLFPCTERP
jgi:hypothetical protein